MIALAVFDAIRFDNFWAEPKEVRLTGILKPKGKKTYWNRTKFLIGTKECDYVYALDNLEKIKEFCAEHKRTQDAINELRTKEQSLEKEFQESCPRIYPEEA